MAKVDVKCCVPVVSRGAGVPSTGIRRVGTVVAWSTVMGRRDRVVVGASAGGVEALRAFVSGLPGDLRAAVLVVMHVAPQASSSLSRILARSCALPVSTAKEDEPILEGHVYVARPDFHLLVREERLELSRGPRTNRHRPAIDPLFFSAARWSGPRAIGVVLSGTLDDGAAGMRAIVRQGGKGLVQDPSEALYPDMPLAAAGEAPQAEMMAARAMGARIAEFCAEEVPDVWQSVLRSEEMRETHQDMESTEHHAAEGAPSPFACPDCHGVLWEVSDGELVRFRCRVGHAFSPEHLAAGQDDALEEALWTAYRALRESAALSHRLAEKAEKGGRTLTQETYLKREADALERARTIERVLGEEGTPSRDRSSGTE